MLAPRLFGLCRLVHILLPLPSYEALLALANLSPRQSSQKCYTYAPRRDAPHLCLRVLKDNGT